MISIIEDTRKTIKVSLPRFFYLAYFYAEEKITVRELLDLLDIYKEEHFVNNIVLDYAYDIMCGLAKPPLLKKGGSHGKT